MDVNVAHGMHGARGKGRRRAPWAIAVALAGSTLATFDARAQEDSRTVAEGAGEISPDSFTWRRHTVAEFEAGAIALPSAPISGHPGGDTPLIGTIGHGDATLQTGLHLLFRPVRELSIGAGGLLAPLPTTDDQYGGATGLPRKHARSYLQLNGEARYFPIRFKVFEIWVGGTVGVVVIGDRFTTTSSALVPAILGSREVTVRTEGLSLGAQLGANWIFAERLVAGLALRYDRWFLPETANCSPIGDCATLTGQVDALEMGLRIGYRLPL